MTQEDCHDDNDDGVVVHLGFIEPVNEHDGGDDQDAQGNHDDNNTKTNRHDWIGHCSPQYNLWDGGQVGGRPSFLDPQNLPTKPITCLSCGHVMRFLLQIYAPIDDYEDRAFHRSFYVFCCPNNHHPNNNSDTTVGTIRVLRVQLPQENPYFPYESLSSAEETADWDAHLPSSYNIQLCRVCGMRGPFKCPLQDCYFCSKQHQKEYKKFVFDVQQCTRSDKKKTAVNELESEESGLDNDDATASLKASTTSSLAIPASTSLPSVYPFAALVVGEEEEQEADGDDDSDCDNDEKATKNRTTLFDYNSDDEEEELDRNLEQDDLNRMTGRKSTVEIQHDVTANFQRTCKSNPWQVLRYARTWTATTNCEGHDSSKEPDNIGNGDRNHPLWIRADHQPHDIPPCPYCKAPRKFEFQLMPQLLHGLERLQQEQRLQQKELSVYEADATGADCEDDQEKNGQPDSDSTAHQTADAEEIKYRQVMEAVQKADDLIQQAPPEQIPPSLVQVKEAAVERLRQERFGLGLQNKTGADAIDWGVVAVYTCTKSCNGGEPADGAIVLDPVLGTYREEFAWRQPSLDAL